MDIYTQTWKYPGQEIKEKVRKKLVTAHFLHVTMHPQKRGNILTAIHNKAILTISPARMERGIYLEP